MRTQDKNGLNKIVEFSLVLSFLFLLIHFYISCYPVFHHFHATNSFVDQIFLKFIRVAPFLESPYIMKAIVLLFVAMHSLGNKGVKKIEMNLVRVIAIGVIGLIIFIANTYLLKLKLNFLIFNFYIFSCLVGYLLTIYCSNLLSRFLNTNLMKDVFNEENETFPQETKLIENEYSVNIRSEFQHKKKLQAGWVNVVNPFRATLVSGLPGSGKSYVVINEFIRQHIAKGFTMFVYDYKFPDLSKLAYNTLCEHQEVYQKMYGTKPIFRVINFDDPSRSHRCNPLNPSQLTDIVDAYESAQTILLNLNKSWISKQGDFFVESPINFLTAIIWFLKLYDDGKYCTFPHAIEFLGRQYEEIFPILASYQQLENYMMPFISALQSGAMEQLEGQIASARIPLSRLSSPQLYWVMSANEFDLDINNPKKPTILCIGNNPKRQAIYGAALGLYNSRIVKLINTKGKAKSSLIIDELPTIYFKGLDNLIATARSNRVSTTLTVQDFSQLQRDYGKAEADVIINTMGNLFAGQVVGDTAKTLQERFGKNVQQRQSVSINPEQTSTSISTALDYMIPASKIAGLTQGRFVGSVADNTEEIIKQKIFHATLKIDEAKVKANEANQVNIPELARFEDMDKTVNDNYYQIKQDILNIIADEMERVKQDPKMQPLLNKLENAKK